jgi:hypothetical protein
MSRFSRRRKVATVVSAIGALTALGLAPEAVAAPPSGTGNGHFTATALHPSSVVEGTKSSSGRLAQSDAALLARTDTAPVSVMVKLDYDASASYLGDVSGLAATSPSVTGAQLTGSSAPEQAYDRYAAKIESSFTSGLAAKVPGAKVGRSLRQVYGGVAVRIPANQAKTLLSLPGVAAVQADTLEHTDAATPTAAQATVEAPTFIGAPTLWSRLGGQNLAGKGVIFADLDTGIWPEHPFFADNPALGTPPAAPSGTARPCVFGDNPLTPATDVFACNHKVIGGKPFLDTYNAVVGHEVYATSARDSDGHGTHTTSTAAGNPLATAPIFGIDRGPISGVAPGAWVLEYKVCGAAGCYSSDSAAAVQQAILDGANVINFSISGGSNPYADPVELAFLDAYNAGVIVSASAGNSGPGAGTTDHHSPWTMTVAASTQTRQFSSTLTVSAAGASATFEGTTLTTGVTTPAPIILAENIPGYDARCSTALPAGSVTGKLVACKRGVTGRVQKGANVLAGGAAGMILYNLPLADVESDNHFLPAIHLADGTAFLAFLAAHPVATGSFAAGAKTNGQGDVMAAFSSRGPGGQFLKPDITGPGVQVLAGNTPTPDAVAAGPAGQYFQAIAGTSMSAPNLAGSAILVKAVHPAWTPGAIKSAIMTTATTAVVKEDLTTAATPFDMGAGRVDLTKAADAPVVFDETTANMTTVGQDPLTAVNLNVPSVNLPTMPGSVTVKRTAKNVSGRLYFFTASATAPAGSRIDVSPPFGLILPGHSLTLTIKVSSTAPEGQYFGRVDLRSFSGPALHLPVAFHNQQGAVSLTQSCTPTSIAVAATSTCTVTAQNNAAADATVRATSTVGRELRVQSATDATVNRRGDSVSAGPVTLAAPKDAAPAIAPIAEANTPGGGYFDLGALGIAPTAIGDESNVNFTVPDFTFGGKTYSSIGVVSNGYVIVGGSSNAADVSYLPQTLPDPARPNGVLAPYWTDLDGGGSPGIRVALLSDGVSSWVVVQWEVHVFGDTTAAGQRKMQAWIGIGSAEDITYSYDASAKTGAPAGNGLTVGAENLSGTAGAQISGYPTGSYVVTTTPGTPGGTASYSFVVKGLSRGTPQVATSSTSDQVVGVTRVSTAITVTR